MNTRTSRCRDESPKPRPGRPPPTSYGFLLGRRTPDLLGELGVVRQELPVRCDLAVAKSVSNLSGESRAARPCPLLPPPSRRPRGGVRRAVRSVQEEKHPRRQASGADERQRQRDGRPCRRPAHPATDAHRPRASGLRLRFLSVATGVSDYPSTDSSCRRPSINICQGLLLCGHGTNSTFARFSSPPSRFRSTQNRHERGSCLAPAALVTREVADTRTMA